MKKYLFFVFIATLFASNVFAYHPVLVIESGSLEFAKKGKGGTATAVFDYSNLQVEGLPLEDFLASKDEEFRHDWEYEIIPESEEAFARYFHNRWFHKLRVQAGGEEETDYKIVLHLNELYLRHIYMSYLTIYGSVDFIDNKTGETLCVVKFDEIGNNQGWSDKQRLQGAYDNLILHMKQAKAKE